MAATLSSKKCCSALSTVTLVNEDPSSLTLVLDPMITPGMRSSSKTAEYTAVNVLLYGLFWVLLALIHLDWMFLELRIRTVLLSFFSISLTSLLKMAERRTFWARNLNRFLLLREIDEY